jgi:hypothetical protein
VLGAGEGPFLVTEELALDHGRPAAEIMARTTSRSG